MHFPKVHFVRFASFASFPQTFALVLVPLVISFTIRARFSLRTPVVSQAFAIFGLPMFAIVAIVSEWTPSLAYAPAFFDVPFHSRL